jgi:phosphoribosyl 1,2-cyclic phosphodiesterase
LFIFDAGTGLRPLGNALIQRTPPVEADIFLSHCHFDHISGLPFFAPCYRASSRLRLWAGNLLPEFELEQVLGMLMAEPLFPTGVAILEAGIEFQDFRAGDLLQPHDAVTLRTAPLNHPGRATGYRLEHDGRSIAYVTDTEHRPGQPDRHVLGLAEGVDLLIYDSNYTDEEFPARVGRGHSTWQEGARLAEAAGARTLAIFHHDPEHDDRFLDRVAAEAAAMRPGTIVAADGMTLAI